MNMCWQIEPNQLKDSFGYYHLRAWKFDSLGRKLTNQPFTAIEAEQTAQITGLMFAEMRAAYLKCQELNAKLREVA